MRTPALFRSLLLAVAAALLFGGCADVQTAPSAGRERPRAGKAMVVFYREDHVLGSPFGFNVRDQFAKIGGLKNASYFVYHTDPGQHYFSAGTEVTETLILRLEPGRAYYVRGSVRAGVVAPRPRLEEVSRAEGSAAIATLEKTTLKPQRKLKY